MKSILAAFTSIVGVICSICYVNSQNPPIEPPQCLAVFEDERCSRPDDYRCQDKLGNYKIIGWENHPTEGNVEIPILEYYCSNVTGLVPENTSGERDLAGYAPRDGFDDIEENEKICYIERDCLYAAVKTASEAGYIPNRFITPVVNGDPGKTPYYKCYCAQGDGPMISEVKLTWFSGEGECDYPDPPTGGGSPGGGSGYNPGGGSGSNGPGNSGGYQ
jgi:hypothetical protein